MDKLPPDVVDAASKIQFDSVRVIIKAEPQNGLVTHHRWIQTISNSSDEPMEYLLYFLEGNIPKAFHELNVNVTEPLLCHDSGYYN